MPISNNILPSTESLEKLLKTFRDKDMLEEVVLGIDKPYILLKNREKIFMDDTPRVRQLYYDFNCFEEVGVRFKSLNFALKYLNSRNN